MGGDPVTIPGPGLSSSGPPEQRDERSWIGVSRAGDLAGVGIGSADQRPPRLRLLGGIGGESRQGQGRAALLSRETGLIHDHADPDQSLDGLAQGLGLGEEVGVHGLLLPHSLVVRSAISSILIG